MFRCVCGRKMNSSHREDLTFNSRLSLGSRASLRNTRWHSRARIILFFFFSFQTKQTLFSWVFKLNASKGWHRITAERGQNELIWLFLGESGSIAFFLLGRTLVVRPWGQRGLIIWGRRRMPFAQALRGSDFNAPLWAVLTANNINSSLRTHTVTHRHVAFGYV